MNPTNFIHEVWTDVNWNIKCKTFDDFVFAILDLDPFQACDVVDLAECFV